MEEEEEEEFYAVSITGYDEEFYTDNEKTGRIYKVNSDETIGELLGHFVNEKPMWNVCVKEFEKEFNTDKFYTDNKQSGSIYEINKDETVGKIVGQFVKGQANKIVEKQQVNKTIKPKLKQSTMSKK